MNTFINVARYHMVDRMSYVILPIAVTAFSFLVNLLVSAVAPSPEAGTYSGGILAPYLYVLVAGALTITKSLPFGFALGLSRRTYYLGTLTFMLATAAVHAAALTMLQGIERITAGWGSGMHFFRVPWLFDGPWYLTLLTSFVLLTLMFSYGMWTGLVYRRWNVPGTVTFVASQVLVVVAAALLVTWTRAWSQVTHLFASLNVLDFTGMLALIVGALALGGFGTIRRVTV